jgi:cephalosporin hydroxylase
VTEQSFYESRESNIRKMTSSQQIKELSLDWLNAVSEFRYAYNFDWLGRPAIQFPNDAWALQEIIWDTRPDLVIETGVAHGGSLLLSASLLALLDICDHFENGPGVFRRKRKVIGIDIELRKDNLAAILDHPLSSYIDLIQGSSVSNKTVNEVIQKASGYNRKMVLLDSNHEYSHVYKELEVYSQLVDPGLYLIVYDTAIELQDPKFSNDRPWAPGNGPMTAVLEFLQKPDCVFRQDKRISDKLAITVAPGGFLRKTDSIV